MGDYFRILGLNYGASQDEIKVAFRKLALLHHPDRHTNSSKAKQEEAAARFKAITEAYEFLTDDRKRAQYEASAHGVNGRRRHSSAHHTYHHNVNTDWAYSNYSHRDHGRARLSWFQQLQRAVGARKLEAGLTLAGVGLLLFGGYAVDAMWLARNQGKSFSDMQAARMSSSSAAAASGPASGEEPGGLAGGSQRPKPYSPAVGCSSRHSVSSVLKQRLPSGVLSDPCQRRLAELPLAELLAEEEAACQQEQGQELGQMKLKQQQRQEDQLTEEGRRRHEAGGRACGGAAAGQDVLHLGGGAVEVENARGADPRGVGDRRPYVDRAVVLPPPSPPGQMAGHHPPVRG